MDRACALARRQRGATLVELMVAMTLGLLVIAGATQVFVGMRQTFSLASAVSARQADAGFVSQQLLRDVRTAQAIEIGSDELTLTLNGDQSAAYCGAAQPSLTLTYRKAGQSLLVAPDCRPEGSVLMAGVSRFLPAWADGGERYGVSLALTLAETGLLPEQTLSFNATSRELALRKALDEE